MNNQLESVKAEYEAITAELSSPEILSDAKKMAELGKRQSELQGLMTLIEKLEKIDHDMKDNATMINGEEDPEMKEMAMEENIELAGQKDIIEKELEVMLLPKDPNDNKDIIVEIRTLLKL